MLGCKPVETPMDSTKKIEVGEDITLLDKERYQIMVGWLIYLSHTRPDIGLSVNVVIQLMNNPTEEHMEAVNRILRYLKMILGIGLLYKKGGNRNVEIYSDTD